MSMSKLFICKNLGDEKIDGHRRRSEKPTGASVAGMGDLFDLDDGYRGNTVRMEKGPSERIDLSDRSV